MQQPAARQATRSDVAPTPAPPPPPAPASPSPQGVAPTPARTPPVTPARDSSAGVARAQAQHAAARSRAAESASVPSGVSEQERNSRVQHYAQQLTEIANWARDKNISFEPGHLRRPADQFLAEKFSTEDRKRILNRIANLISTDLALHFLTDMQLALKDKGETSGEFWDFLKSKIADLEAYKA